MDTIIELKPEVVDFFETLGDVIYHSDSSKSYKFNRMIFHSTSIKGTYKMEFVDNTNSIYRMLHDFRNWNRDWDKWMSKKPDDVDKFVESLSKKYSVIVK